MNSKQRRKEYRRLVRKCGVKYYTLKIDDDLFGIFEHISVWHPRFNFEGPKARRKYRVDEISKAEYETFIAFDFPVLEKTGHFNPIKITLPQLKARYNHAYRPTTT